MKQFIRQGYVENLDGLSAEQNWQNDFSASTLQKIKLNRNEAMPYLFRDLSAFILNGNSLSNRIPTNVEKNIGFMPFPEISTEHAGYVDAKTFRAYLSQPDVQTS